MSTVPIPAPGARMPVTDQTKSVGTGQRPRFALFGLGDDISVALFARNHELLEEGLRRPLAEGTITLVRPDGYVAVVAKHGEWARIDAYLHKIPRAVKTGLIALGREIATEPATISGGP